MPNARAPHAISCGHVFCLQCLRTVRPTICPLCRKTFVPDRIKKLHVDPYPSDNPAETDESIQVTGFLQRIALVSGEKTPEETVQDVISEVNRWLSARERSQPLYRPVCYAAAALQRSVENREALRETQALCEQQKAHFEKYVYEREEERRRTEAIEENLVKSKDDLEEELVKAKRALQECDFEIDRLRDEHAQFRAELARRHLRIESSPAAPHTSRTDNRRSRVLTGSHSSQKKGHMMRVGSEPTSASYSVVEPVEQKPPAKPQSKLYVIVPGAPASRKVVPSSLTSSRTSGHRNPSHSLSDAAIDDVDLASSQNPDISAHAPPVTAPRYGFVPGIGYVHTQPAPAVSTRVPEGGAGGQLVLYDHSHDAEQVSQDNRRGLRSAAGATGLLGPRQTVDVGSNGGHIQSATPQNSTITSTSAATVVPTGRSYHTSHSASNSLTHAGLHVAFASAFPQPTLDVVRIGSPSPEPSLASSWGTVPTNRSARSVSVQDLNLTGLPAAMEDLDLSSGLSSSNTSLADLRLTRLPDPSTDNGSLSSVTGPSTRGIVAPITPRALTWHNDVLTQSADASHLVSSSGRRPTDHLARGNATDVDVLTPRIRHSSTQLTTLGLSMSNDTSGLHISGTDDLDQVNRSLLRAVNESRGSASRVRHSRAVSMSDAEDYSAPESRRRFDHSGNADDPVRSDNRTNTHRRTSTSNRSSSTSGDEHLFPHTDRISGPPQLPVASQRSDTHTDRNRERRRSSMTASNPSSTSSRDIPHVRPPPPEVIRPPTSGYAPSFSHTHNHSRPASAFPLQSSSSIHSDSSGGSLGLSLVPLGPGASAATTASGEPSTIRAPRPVNSSHSSNFFAMWDRAVPR